MKLMNIKKKISLIVIFIFSYACSLSPGMHMDTKSTWLDESKYVYIDSLENIQIIINISEI